MLCQPELDAERELRRRLEPRIASWSAGSGWTARIRGRRSSAKERIGAKEARRARRAGIGAGAAGRPQPGRAARAPGQGPAAGTRTRASGRTPEPPAQCRPLQGGPGGRGGGGARARHRSGRGSRQDGYRVGAAGRHRARAAGRSRSRIRPPGAHAGSVSYGPVLNAAAVLLTSYGNVPPERAAQRDGHAAGCPGLGRVDWTRPVPGCPRGWREPGSMRRCSRR